MKIILVLSISILFAACSNDIPVGKFSSNFEDCSVGKLTDRETKRMWAGAEIICGKKDYLLYKTGLTPHPHYIAEEMGNHFLQVLIPKKKFGPLTGAQWKIPLNPSDECTFSYKIKVSDSFDFVKGGKLPGLAGGTANSGGNVPNGYDGWSVRLMFWEKGKLSFYAYLPNQTSKWGERFYFKNKQGDTIKIEQNKWHKITQHIKMNTPNKADGILQGWIDEETAFSSDSIMFRKSNDLNIDQILYSVFMGGDNINWAPKKEQIIAFDNFLITYTSKQE